MIAIAPDDQRQSRLPKENAHECPRQHRPAAPILVPARDHGRRGGPGSRPPGRGEPDAIVVVRDGEGKLRDLSWVPEADTEVTPVPANSDEGGA